MYPSGGSSCTARARARSSKGIFPASVDLTTDLHSMGQFIQDGTRLMFETVLEVEHPTCELVIEAEESDLDGLNYLAGKTVDFVNKSAMNGTILAHTDGECAEPDGTPAGAGRVQPGPAVLFLRIRLRHQRIYAGRQSVQPARRREL